MKLRSYAVGILIVASVAAIGVVSFQRKDITNLRLEQQRLLEESDAAHAAILPVPSKPVESRPPPPPELLQLRGEVTRLMGTPRDLDSARAENKRLRAQLAARQTNAPGKFQLPPGYMLASEAQWMGLSSPENTLQSFLWAARNANLDNLLRTLTPETAQRLQEEFVQSDGGEGFRKELRILPGMRFASQETLPDGSIEAKLEIMPGHVQNKSWRFQLIAGEWKLEMPR
jgi:hypothetical protein